MQVELLPAAPLPGGVKVARRSVKPFVLVRVQVWQPIFRVQCQQQPGVCTRPPARKEEDAGATPATLAIFGRQADTSWLHLSRKQDRLKPEVGALPTPSAILAVCQHLTATLNERKPMRPVIRYQSQLLYRKSYKPDRVIRIRPAKLNFAFRPVRFGLKPQIKTYECETH